MSRSTSLTMLRYGALLAAFAALCQGALGFILATRAGGLTPMHSVVAYILTAAALWCVVWAFLARRAGAATSLFGHAIGMFVLSLLMIGLGEMQEKMGALRWVHIGLGVLYVIGMVALGALALRGGDGDDVVDLHHDPAADAAAKHLDHAAENVARTRKRP